MKTSPTVLLVLSTLTFSACSGGDSAPQSVNTNTSTSVSGNNSNTDAGTSDDSSQTDNPSVPVGTPVSTIQKKGVKFVSRRALEVANDFSNLDEVKEKLNQFTIEVSLDKAISEDASIKCSEVREGLKNNNMDKSAFNGIEETTIVAGELAEKIEFTMNAKDLKSDVNCEVLVDGESISAVKLSFLASLYVTKTMSFERGANFDRIILTQGSELLFKSDSPKVTAVDLYSHDGTFATYSTTANTNAKDSNIDGYSGGKIDITVGRSYGKLSVLMNGTDADDQKIVPPQVTTRGANGANAVAGKGQSHWEEDDDGRHFYVVDWEDPGSPAEDGKQGPPGLDGKNGNNGGNSGKMSYKTGTIADGFIFNLSSRAGKGGKGGEPGKGGPGGAPGAGASTSPEWRSYPAATGYGADGVPGKAGIDGVKGNIEESCFTITSRQTKQCDSEIEISFE